MNPARLLMPTSPPVTAGLTASARPRQVNRPQINTGVPARLTQTKLAMAVQRRTAARVRARRVGRRLRRRMPE